MTRYFAIAALALLVLVPTASAQTTWTGASGTNWETPGNWSAGVPVDSETVTIPDPTTLATPANQPILSAQTANDLVIQIHEDASIDLSGNNLRLDDITVTGTSTNTATISGAGTVSLTGDTGNVSTFALTGGSLSIPTATVVTSTLGNAADDISVTGNGTLIIGLLDQSSQEGDWLIGSSGTPTVEIQNMTPNGGVIEVTASGRRIDIDGGSLSFGIDSSGPTTIETSPVDIDGTIDITAGSLTVATTSGTATDIDNAITLSAGSLTVTSTLINVNPVMTVSGGALTYNGNVTQFDEATDVTSGSLTANGTYLITGSNANDPLNVTGGTVNLNGSVTTDDAAPLTISGTGGVTITGDLNLNEVGGLSVTGTTASLTVTGNTATGASSTGAISFTGSATIINLNGNLTLNSSGDLNVGTGATTPTVTIGGNLTHATSNDNDLNLAGGTLEIQGTFRLGQGVAGDVIHSGGTLIVGGDWIASNDGAQQDEYGASGTATVIFNGNSAQSIQVSDVVATEYEFVNLQFSGTGTKTFTIWTAPNIVVSQDLTIADGATVDFNGQALSIGDDFDVQGSTSCVVDIASTAFTSNNPTWNSPEGLWYGAVTHQGAGNLPTITIGGAVGGAIYCSSVTSAVTNLEVAVGTFTGLSVSPTSTVAGTSTTHTLTINTTGLIHIPSRGKIVITYPAGFGVTDGVTSASWANGTVTTSVSGQVVTVTRTGGNALTPGSYTLTLANVTNNTTAGTAYTVDVQVETAKVTAPPEVVLGSDTSSTFSVTHAAAAALVWTQQPTNTVANVVMSPSPTVETRDAFGNVCDTGADSTLTINITLSSGVLDAGGSAVSSNGVATFNAIQETTAGTYTLGAQDSGATLTSVNSSSFDITNDVAAALVWVQQPTTTTAGVTMSPSPTVRINDAFGNQCTTGASATLQIDLTLSAGSLDAGGSATASGGLATFNAIQETTTGSYTLDAQDNGATLTAVTSSGFNINNAAAAALVWVQQPTNTVANIVMSPSPTVRINDAFGNLCTTGASATLQIDLTLSAGSLDAGGSATAAGGVATFNAIQETTAGTYTLGAQDNGATLSSVNSSSFDITHAAAAQLAWVQQPTNTVANVVMSPSPTVEIQDAFGNTVLTGGSSGLTINITLSSGTLDAGGSAVASAGVATFNAIQETTAGTYTLSAVDSGATLAAVGSSSFDITNAAAAALVWVQQPSDTVAGVTMAPSPTVRIDDAFGNQCTTGASATLQIDLTLSSGALDTGASATASGGLATFNAITETTANTGYTLTAQDNGATLTGVGSSAFNITHAAAAQLTWLQQPTNTVAGVTMSPSPTVRTEDAFGNLCTTGGDATLTINLTLSSGTLDAGGTAISAGGVATFAAIQETTANTNYTLSARDSGLTLPASGSGTFDITHAAAAQLGWGQQPTNTTAGVTMSPSPTVEIQDAFGNPCLTGASSTLTINITLSVGTLDAGGSAVASNGVATFNGIQETTALTNYTLSAQDSGATLTAVNSTTFDITNAAAAALVWVQQPTNTVAGVTMAPSPTVRIDDAFGNQCTTGASATLQIDLTLSAGSLDTGASATASGGLATFNAITETTAATGYTLTAQDNGATLTGVGSSAFNITHAAATQLAWGQQPTNATAGVAISPSPTVIIQDAFGNTVLTGASSSLTINLTLSVGLLDSGGSAVASSGVATFAAIVETTAATNYTLSAVDSLATLPATVSSTFDITAGAPANIAFTTQPPANGFATVVLAPPITVSVTDAFANPVPSTQVDMTMNGAPPNFHGTSTTMVNTNASGIATFSNLRVDTSGTNYTMRATSNAVGTVFVDSNPFNILSGPPDDITYQIQPVTTTAGVTMASFTVLLEDSGDNPLSGEDITISGVPFASGTVTRTTNGSGIATFNDIVITTAATGYQITATSVSVPGVTQASASFNIDPATANSIVFATQPATTTAGVTMANFTVEFRDVYNNLTTTGAANTTISGPTFAAGTLTRAPSGGVCTFNDIQINIAQVGYTITANGGGFNVVSSAFNIDPAAAANLVYQSQPVDSGVLPATLAGASGNIEVAVVDAFGNVRTSDNSTQIDVVLGVNPGAATLGGTNPVTVVNGVATFSDLTIDQAALGYRLDADDNGGGLATIQSNLFNVGFVIWIGDVSPGRWDIPGNYETISGVDLTVLPGATDVINFRNAPTSSPNTGAPPSVAGIVVENSYTGTITIPAAQTLSVSGNISVDRQSTPGLFVTNGQPINAGALVLSDLVSVDFSGSTVTIPQVTLNDTSTLNTSGSLITSTNVNLVGAGSVLNVSGTGSVTTPFIQGSGTVNGLGTSTLNLSEVSPGSPGPLRCGAATFAATSTVNLTGTNTIINGSFTYGILQIPGTATNATVANSPVGATTLSVDAGTINGGTSVFNVTTLDILNAGTLTTTGQITATNINVTSGSLNNSADVDFTSTFTISGAGSVNLPTAVDGPTVNLSGTLAGNATYNLTTLSMSGAAADISGNATFNLPGALTIPNDAGLDISGAPTFVLGGDMTFNGSQTFSGTPSVTFTGASATLATGNAQIGLGTLTINQGCRVTGNTTPAARTANFTVLNNSGVSNLLQIEADMNIGTSTINGNLSEIVVTTNNIALTLDDMTINDGRCRVGNGSVVGLSMIFLPSARIDLNTGNARLEIQGLDSSNRIIITGSVPGNQGQIDINTGTFTVTNVEVENNQVNPGITAPGSAAGAQGNAINWTFTGGDNLSMVKAEVFGSGTGTIDRAIVNIVERDGVTPATIVTTNLNLTSNEQAFTLERVSGSTVVASVAGEGLTSLGGGQIEIDFGTGIPTTGLDEFRVSYTNPGTNQITGTSFGDPMGLDANLATQDTELVDNAIPELVSASVTDTNGNGMLDQLRFVFSEKVHVKAARGISISGYEPDTSSLPLNSLDLTISGAALSIPGATFSGLSTGANIAAAIQNAVRTSGSAPTDMRRPAWKQFRCQFISGRYVLMAGPVLTWDNTTDTYSFDYTQSSVVVTNNSLADALKLGLGVDNMLGGGDDLGIELTGVGNGAAPVFAQATGSAFATGNFQLQINGETAQSLNGTSQADIESDWQGATPEHTANAAAYAGVVVCRNQLDTNQGVFITGSYGANASVTVLTNPWGITSGTVFNGADNSVYTLRNFQVMSAGGQNMLLNRSGSDLSVSGNSVTVNLWEVPSSGAGAPSYIWQDWGDNGFAADNSSQAHDATGQYTNVTTELIKIAGDTDNDLSINLDPGANILDASASIAPMGTTGETLSYSWSVSPTSPITPTILSGANTSILNFLATTAGTYRFLLTITVLDGSGNPVSNVGSDPNGAITREVTVVINSVAPVADAGTDQIIFGLSNLVQVDGSGSYDPNGGGGLLYSWSAVDQNGTAHPDWTPAPTNAVEDFNNPPGVNAGQGVWTVTLLTTKGALSDNDTVQITMVNPSDMFANADAGPDIVGRVGVEVTLDGSGSRDPEDQTLTYTWIAVSTPEAVTLVGSTTSQATFTPTTPGEFVFQLTVNDGTTVDTTDTVTVYVTDDSSTSPRTAPGARARVTSVNQGVFMVTAPSQTFDTFPPSLVFSDGTSKVAAIVDLASSTTDDPSAGEILGKHKVEVFAAGALLATLYFEADAEDQDLTQLRLTDGTLHDILFWGIVGESMMLDASKSTDDGIISDFTWTQTAGPFLFTTQTGETVPIIPQTEGTYVFSLVAKDSFGLSSFPSTATVRVLPSGLTTPVGPPVAIVTAGANITTFVTSQGDVWTTAAGSTIGLEANTSLDLSTGVPTAGGTLTYRWTQFAGPMAELSNTTTSTLSARLQTSGAYGFEVEVTDPTHMTTDTARVWVTAAATSTTAPVTNLATVANVVLPSGTTLTINLGPSSPQGVQPVRYIFSQTSGPPAFVESTGSANILVDGVYTFEARTVDANGVVSAPATATLFVTRPSPDALSSGLESSSDSGCALVPEASDPLAGVWLLAGLLGLLTLRRLGARA